MLSAQLEDLQRCLERQLLSEAEYNEQRRTLLRSFSSRSLSALAPLDDLAGEVAVAQADYACEDYVARKHSVGEVVTRKHSVEEVMQSFQPLGSESLTAPGGQPMVPVGEQSRPAWGYMDDGPAFDDTGEIWCNLIREASLSTSFSPSHRHNEMTMAALQVYDITAGRVHELFVEYDVDGDGLISCTELEDGLKQLDLRIIRRNVESIVEHMVSHKLMDPGHAQQQIHLTEQEFRLLLARLRLAELFTPSAGVFQYQAYSSERYTCPTFICDYNRQHCYVSQLMLGGGEDALAAQKYFFSRRKHWCPGSERVLGPRSTTARISRRDVRWVHIDGMDGLDRLTLLRLAVKYGLHPLAVDDIIDNRTPTKLDVFAEHYFVSVDVLTLSATADDLRDGRGKDVPPQRVRIHRSNVSLFLSRPPYCDTLVTILQNREDESSWMAMWRARDSAPILPDYGWWAQLQETLTQDKQQRMRERRADFLLYEILDRIVDQLRPIAEAYARRLGYMHRTPAWRFPQAWLDELDEVQLELRDLARSIRPMRQVLRHFVSDGQFSAGVPRLYLEDVEDGIDQMLEDILQLQEMGKTLEEAHEAHRDKRMNATLYVLSVISAIFLPAQFVTGLYGMNFVNDDGKPTIPELLWPNGYEYFWYLELCLVVVGLFGAYLLHYSSMDFCSLQRLPCCGLLSLGKRFCRQIRCLPCRRRYGGDRRPPKG